MSAFKSLRSRLILAILLIQSAMLALILWSGEEVVQKNLMERIENRRWEQAILLEAALATPMAQADYGAVADVLWAAQASEGIDYLVMLDLDDKIIAAANWDHAQPLPPLDADLASVLRHNKPRFDISIPIGIGAQRFGRLQYGMSLAFVARMQAELRRQILIVASLGVLLSLALTAWVTVWLTRHLKTLVRASQELAAGRLETPLPETSDRDLESLTQAFRHMARSLEQRLAELAQAAAEQADLARNLDTERARLQALLSSMRLGLVFVTAERQVAYLNPAFAHLWRLSTLPTPPLALAALQDSLANTRLINFSQEAHLFADTSSQQELHLSDGRIITQQAVDVREGETEQGRLWLFDDITAERQVADRLKFMAERDPLTGLANRNRFETELQRLTQLRQHHPDLRAALLYFDLDEFKSINDTFGHRAGDGVLLKVAGEVGQLLRNGELFARLGGDEFAILAENMDVAAAQALAERIVTRVSQVPIEFEGRQLRLTTSLGIAMLPQHGDNPEDLVAHADAAMYLAKGSGKNAYRLYSPDADTTGEMLAQLSWRQRIRWALDNDGLVLCFQGVYATADRSLSHLEVLLRMHDPDRPGEWLMPSQFIPAAERNGLILDIDRWVLRAAVALLRAEPRLPALAINLSARSFEAPDLPDYITRVLRQNGVAPQRLLLELTETAALSNIRQTESFIATLRQLGCPVCLDDFGVGFSSFAYLKHLDADVLKIDGMFIRNLPANREDQVFVRAIVEVARGLGKKTVAEFVEDGETLALLAEFGVDYAQGYFLHRPSTTLPALGPGA